MSLENYDFSEEFSEEYNKTRERMLEISSRFGHGYVTLDHCVLALLDDKDARAVLESGEVNINGLRAELESRLAANGTLKGDGTLEDHVPTEDMLQAHDEMFEKIAPVVGKPVNGAMFLVSIMQQSDSGAVSLLRKYGFSFARAREVLDGMIRDARSSVQTLKPLDAPAPRRSGYVLTPGGPALTKFAVNLNEKAIRGKIDPLIGREGVIEQMAQILTRRKKNNPMLVGEEGVGKTAIAEGLAKAIVEGRVPEKLGQSTIFALDLGAMVAGTQFRGQFEERLKNVMEEAATVPGAILFIDEIHTVIGVGGTSGSELNGSNILKPALGNGDIRCIGATTYNEFKAFEKKDKALLRRFGKVDVPEPSVADTKLILKGLQKQYERHHNVTYTTEAVDAAVELADRYLYERKMPDKAIDLIDESGAQENMDSTARGGVRLPVDVEQIEAIVARKAGLPSKRVSMDDKKALANLEGDIKQNVFDQDEAVGIVAEKIRLSRAGLRDHEKPIANFLFTGPTGVGKTELTRQLAQIMGLKLLRFDMSEFGDKHTVSRLIGAPPGYVGYEEGGKLTDAVYRSPYSVVLLDEIEKAHPDIYNILLQVMDHGKLTDGSGKEVSFRNVLLIMTTNAGAAEMQQSKLGFSAGKKTDAGNAAILRQFTPEFRNRLDAVVPFRSLPPETSLRIADKFIGRLKKRLAEQHVTLDLTDAAREYLAREGFDDLMGARPMERLVEKEVSVPLSKEILSGSLQNGGGAFCEFSEIAGGEGKPGLKFTFNSKAKGEKAPEAEKKQVAAPPPVPAVPGGP